MSKLILSFEGTMLKTVDLNKERITIGRRPDNDIQVDNLAVSGLHATVTTVLNDSVIEDQNSTNGTLINGEIGKHTLRYVVETATATPYQEFAKTMVIRRPDAAAHGAHAAHAEHAPPLTHAAVPAPRPAPAAAAPAPVLSREAALKILTGSAAGRILDLNKSLTTIGKAGVQVAVFTRRPVGFFVTHVEGDVFPLINGESLGTQARQLNDQDTIEIAGTKMIFIYKT